MTPNALAVKPEGAVAVAGVGLPGVENIGDSDRIYANVILVQTNTKSSIRGNSKAGDFINASTQQVLTDKTFVPVFLTKYFNVYKDDKQREFAFRTNKETDTRLTGMRFRADGDKKAQVVPVLACLGLFDQRPLKVFFKNKSGYPAGQKLYSYAAQAYETSQTPLWGQKYELFSAADSNDQGEWFNMGVRPAGPSTENEMAQAAKIFNSRVTVEDVVEAE